MSENSLKLYQNVCAESSAMITKRYSTSFASGIKAFAKPYREPIYNIYGFVRFADEIVDTFHGHDKAYLLDKFKQDTFEAIRQGISLNPVLHSFQDTVNKYGIEQSHIEAFLKSMEMDLYQNEYSEHGYKDYIFGSAEVVGLMCLKVFCDNNEELYQRLKASACSLGSAFQKINFLRDIKSDFDDRGRVYFPNVDFTRFTEQDKRDIEKDIKSDFDHAYTGIVQLPKGVRFGVYVAYVYYLNLFKKIKSSKPDVITQKRVRVNDGRKAYLLLSSAVRNSLGML